MDVKRVVLVAPEFPPANTAGAHRPRLFARHLPAFGWTPIVLTVRPDQIEGPLDPLLEGLVDPALRVIRTGALPIRPLRLVGDIGIRTLPAHARALLRLIRDRRVDAMVVFGPPWFSFVHGPIWRRLGGVPYVVDYIDPWISAFSAAQPFPAKGWWYHRLATAIEPAVLRSAAAVTAVSAGMIDGLRQRYPWLEGTPMTAMPYGAEPGDLEAAARAGITPPDFAADRGEFTICFTGAVQPRGQELVRVVLEAVRRLRQTASPLAGRLRLRFYGTSNLTWGHDRYMVRPLAREMGLDGAVSEIPERVPYLTAMAILSAADVVLVMGSTNRYYDASKLYPALIAGRPILGICHAASNMRHAIESTHAGVAVTFDEQMPIGGRVDAVQQAIVDLSNRPPRPPRPEAIERFTARESTRALAAVLDRCVAGRASAREARLA